MLSGTDGAQEFFAARSLGVAEIFDPPHPLVTSVPALVAVCFVQEFIGILSALSVLKTLGWFSKKLNPSIGRKNEFLENVVTVQSPRRTANIQHLKVNINCF